MKRYLRAALIIAIPFINASCQRPLTYQPLTPVYDEKRFLEPLSAGLVIGKAPKIEKSAPPKETEAAASPLPPLLIRSGRPIYLYNNLYYYFWNKKWYFSRARTGPWYALPAKFYPKETREVPVGVNAPVMPLRRSVRP